MTYDSEKPHEYILTAYKSILNVDIPLITEVGHIIPLPQFDEEILIDLCIKTKQYFIDMPTLLEIEGPIIVVGDLHGNIFDLLRLITVNRPPPQQKYLFLGDYVDRGEFSVEVITIILALMLMYPNTLYLLRGNHESESMNSIYGFRRELLLSNYSNDLFVHFNHIFDLLPLAAILSHKYFCVHGGLPDIQSFDEIRSIERPASPLTNSLVQDLIWSDPSSSHPGFSPSRRGSGKNFGKAIINKYLNDFNLKGIFRAHQCITSGVEQFDDTPLYTIFSCSNYCFTYNNNCGYINVSEDTSFQAYSLLPLPQIRRSNTSMIRCPTAFIPVMLTQQLISSSHGLDTHARFNNFEGNSCGVDEVRKQETKPVLLTLQSSNNIQLGSPFSLAKSLHRYELNTLQPQSQNQSFPRRKSFNSSKSLILLPKKKF